MTWTCEICRGQRTGNAAAEIADGAGSTSFRCRGCFNRDARLLGSGHILVLDYIEEGWTVSSDLVTKYAAQGT